MPTDGGWITNRGRDGGFQWTDHYYRPRPPLIICPDCLGCGKVLDNREVKTCETCEGEGLSRTEQETK